MDKKIYLSFMAALASMTALYLFALLAAPVAKPFAWALIIGISTIHQYNRISDRFPAHPNRNAGLMVLLVTFCLILPVAALTVMVIQNAEEWYVEGEFLAHSFTTRGGETLSHFPYAKEIIHMGESIGLDLSNLGARISAAISRNLMELATDTAKNIGELAFTIVIALFLLFFIYRDGERIVFTAINRFSTDRDRALHFYSGICSTTTIVTVGTIFTCLVQGMTAGVGYYAAGAPAPMFFGALTAISALVPVVGTGLIWIPMTALVAIKGAYLKAALLALWCVLLVGLADNAIRALAIGVKSNIPIPAIVMGAICGLYAFGILGLLLGPILFSIFFSVCGEILSPSSSPND
jgi:predicted PurR-regulated permease PerM